MAGEFGSDDAFRMILSTERQLEYFDGELEEESS
jgi:hypothetical protein